jgi:hypothetical protein
MGYKGGNMYKGLEVVNQVTDTFRYPHMKSQTRNPCSHAKDDVIFVRIEKFRWVLVVVTSFCTLPKNVSERRADLILARTSLQTGLSLLLSVESAMPEHWPCVSFVSHDEVSFAGCWKAEDSWPYLPGAGLLERAIQLVKKFLDFYYARNLTALLTKAQH